MLLLLGGRDWTGRPSMLPQARYTGCWLRCDRTRALPTHSPSAVWPNPSLKRSAHGRQPVPAWQYTVHFPQPGPGFLPSSPA